MKYAYELISNLWSNIYFIIFKNNDRKNSNKVTTALVIFLLSDIKNKNEYELAFHKLLKKFDILLDQVQIDEIKKLYFDFFKDKKFYEKENIRIGTERHIELMKIEAACLFENTQPYANINYVKLFELEILGKSLTKTL